MSHDSNDRTASADASFGWMANLARISPVGIYRCDATGQCIYVNERCCELAGLTAEEAKGSGWERAIHPLDRGRILEQWVRLVQAGELFRAEYRYLRPDGSSVWIFGESAEERDANGVLTGFIGTATDITELRNTREALEAAQAELEVRVRERTEKLRETTMVVDQIEDAVIQSDYDGLVVSWNRAAERLFGYTAEQMMGQTTLALTPVAERLAATKVRRRVRAGESIHGYETVRVRKDGRHLDVELTVFPLRDENGNVFATTAIIRDITERKRAQAQLRQLSQGLLRAQDEERRRIARELHDSTAQLLAAMTINLGQVCSSRRLTKRRREQLLAECTVFAERALMEVRTQSYLLHPPLLDERGLVAALGFFIDGFIQRSGIEVAFRAQPGLEGLCKTLELTLFRIVQEALTNVHRHSGSARAEINVTHQDGWISLTVRDFGRGFSRPINSLNGVGIAGIRERMMEIGGTFQIESASPGTQLNVKLRAEYTPHEDSHPVG
jgi:PAS domain S-box-containing protein